MAFCFFDRSPEQTKKHVFLLGNFKNVARATFKSPLKKLQFSKSNFSKKISKKNRAC
jgi:hypothetical protein